MELTGVLPLLLLAAAACVQALLLALTVVFAQVAADRAARGLPRAEVLASVPSGWRERARVRRDGSTVSVALRTPSTLPGATRIPPVEATARVSA